MGTQGVTFRLQTEGLPAKEDILKLANFCDQRGNAVSFYFGRTTSPDNAHHEEATTIRKLVRDAIKSFGAEAAPDNVLGDLDGILDIAEEIRSAPSGLHMVFACAGQHIWKEFHLATPHEASFLRVGRSFSLAPMLQALQSAAPFAVVLLESGKARAFIVRGSAIQELTGRLPVADLRLPAQDSRVGWSKHIQGNQAEHERAYFRKVCYQAQNLMAEHHAGQLIIGCREDLWGEIEPQLEEIEKNKLIGRFHLSSFDITAPEVLDVAGPIFSANAKKRVAEVLRRAGEDFSHGVFGTTETLEALRAGRVRTLLLESRSGEMLKECRHCGQMAAPGAGNCVFCGQGEFCSLPAEEALLRLALLGDAEILFVEDGGVPGFIGAAALLRY